MLARDAVGPIMREHVAPGITPSGTGLMRGSLSERPPPKRARGESAPMRHDHQRGDVRAASFRLRINPESEGSARMPKGGRREGAGRPRGSRGKRTEESIAK